MSNKTITIDTSRICIYRGRAIGRAFFNAYNKFISDPDNEKKIEQRAAEIREREKNLNKQEAV